MRYTAQLDSVDRSNKHLVNSQLAHGRTPSSDLYPKAPTPVRHSPLLALCFERVQCDRQLLLF
jgi:hypothetical protein